MMWDVIYWVLLSIAWLVLLRGLLWDRAGFRGRPKRRCRKCWYDLTGIDIEGNPARRAGPPGAVVCPECGKGHKTKRSMRRTRRGQKWILAALVVWLMAYAAGVTPRVQKNGWGAAVPGTVVIASLPLLPDDPGSATMFPTPAQGKWARYQDWAYQRILRVYPRMDRAKEETGWFSNRLAFLLARIQYHDAFPDKSSRRGRAYAAVLSRLVHGGAAYGFEADWTRSCVRCRIDVEGAFVPDEMVYGHYNFQRLLDGPYRVQLGYVNQTFECRTNSGRFFGGRGLSKESMISSMRFDYAGTEQTQQIMYPRDMGNGVGLLEVPFSVLENKAERGETEQWVRVSQHEHRMEIELDPARSPMIDSSSALRAEIESAFEAKLTKAYSQQRGDWTPVLRLALRNGKSPPAAYPQLIFGGRMSLKVVWQLDGTPYPSGEGDCDARWWEWSSETREVPDFNLDGVSVADQRAFREEIEGDMATQSGIVTSRGMTTAEISGALRLQGDTPVHYKNKNYTIVARIESSLVSPLTDFGGLRAPVVYSGDLEFVLRRWTIEELQQFIVNGIVPDHATP